MKKNIICIFCSFRRLLYLLLCTFIHISTCFCFFFFRAASVSQLHFYLLHACQHLDFVVISYFCGNVPCVTSWEVRPTKYSHGLRFGRFRCGLVSLCFTHILHDCFTNIGEIVWFYLYELSSLSDYGYMRHTKHWNLGLYSLSGRTSYYCAYFIGQSVCIIMVLIRHMNCEGNSLHQQTDTTQFPAVKSMFILEHMLQ